MVRESEKDAMPGISYSSYTLQFPTVLEDKSLAASVHNSAASILPSSPITFSSVADVPSSETVVVQA